MSTPTGPQDPYGASGEQNPYGQPGQTGQPGQPPSYPQPTYGQPAQGQQYPQTPSYGQYGQPGYPTGQYAGGGTEQNNLGVWALVLGIVSILCSLGFLTGIPAIIVGKKSKQAAALGRANNGGMGTAGVILGWIGTILSIIGIIIFAILVATVGWDELINDGWSYSYNWES